MVVLPVPGGPVDGEQAGLAELPEVLAVRAVR
jgi:hypothetical protein